MSKTRTKQLRILYKLLGAFFLFMVYVSVVIIPQAIASDFWRGFYFPFGIAVSVFAVMVSYTVFKYEVRGK